MRYAYAITSALLIGGASVALVTQNPAGAQTAQNEPGSIQSSAPRAGAPMSFADMVSKLQPAVVNISTTQRVQVSNNPFAGTPFGEMFGGQQGGRPVTRQAESLGSGFLVSADGYVVTNNHVISADRRSGAVVESIKVILADRREYTAKLVGRDPASDLAVLKIEGANLPFVRLGNSDAARVGDWVVAIGNPFGLGGSVTAGIVSAVHRSTTGGPFDRFIQTDASINRGNSGGPLFDLNGNVIGINSQIYSPTGGNVGIGFSIPASEAKPIIDQLMKGQTIQRGYLGVQIQPWTDDLVKSFGVRKNQGELISSVMPDGPAAKAGIRQGDVITKVGGRDVNPDQTLSYLSANLKPGVRVPIELLRDGKTVTVQLTPETRPPEEQLGGFDPDAQDDGSGNGEEQGAQGAASAGVNVVALTPQIARSIGVDANARGVVVLGVDPAADAAQKLRRGDLIASVNRTPVTNPAEFNRLVAQAKSQGADQVLLYVQRRGGVSAYVSIDIN